MIVNKIDSTIEFKIKVTGEFIRILNGSHTNSRLKTYLKTFEEIQSLSPSIKFQTKYGYVSLKINWDSIVKACHDEIDYVIDKDTLKTLENFTLPENFEDLSQSEFAKLVDSWPEIKYEPRPAQVIEVEASVNALPANTLFQRLRHFKRYKSTYIEIFLQDIFLAANIASPGSFNLDRAKIENTNYLLNSSNDLFEDCFVQYIDFKWPRIEHLSFNKTWEWLKKVKAPLSLVGDNNIKSSLFALLWACQDSGADTNKTVWIVHMLESLYSTPPALSKNFLRERMSSLLEINPSKIKTLRKSIDSIYNIRNSFVHGGYNVCHPLSFEFDHKEKNYNKDIKNIFQANKIGLSLILSTFQKYILKNARGISYSETLNIY